MVGEIQNIERRNKMDIKKYNASGGIQTYCSSGYS
jgi:hypothetical protein